MFITHKVSLVDLIAKNENFICHNYSGGRWPIMLSLVIYPPKECNRQNGRGLEISTEGLLMSSQ